MTELQIATAEAIITPPVGVEMLEPRGIPSTAIHDDLYARVLAFTDGHTQIFLVALDLLGLDQPLVEAIRGAVQNQTGTPPSHLLLAPSHNHSAPVTLECGPATQANRDRAWEARLVAAVVAAVRKAQQGWAPATLAVGRAPVQLGFNRRVSTLSRTRMAANPYGPVMPQVDVLAVRREDGSLLALLFSHAAHPVTVHVAASEISADYPGVAVREIRRRLGEGVTPLFAQGCAGNINVDPLAGGFGAADAVGKKLADAVLSALEQAETVRSSPLAVASREIELPFEAVELDVAQTILARVQEATRFVLETSTDERERGDQQATLWWAQRLVQYAAGELGFAGMPFQVQGFRLGADVALLGLSNEPFVEYQQHLQSHSLFRHTFVFGYTNACLGYMPTADAYYLGGYEAHGAHKLFGLPRLDPKSESVIKALGRQLLADLT